MVSPASADILPPKKQTSFGITDDDIVCESGMFKVIKASTNSVSCVNVKSVSKLMSLGWVKPTPAGCGFGKVSSTSYVEAYPISSSQAADWKNRFNISITNP